jgi:hypothetical protein
MASSMRLLVLASLLSAGATAQDPLDLGVAAGFTILAKTGVTNTGPSEIVGDIGVSPIGIAACTGWSLTPVLIKPAKSAQVVGDLTAADMGGEFAIALTAAVGDMEAAYTEAAGRATTPLNGNNFGGKELLASDLIMSTDAGRMAGASYCKVNQVVTSTQVASPADCDADTFGTESGTYNNVLAGAALDRFTLTPGVYTWNAAVTVGDNAKLYLNGNLGDVFILRTTGNIVFGAGAEVVLNGGVTADTIFWQSAGILTVLAGAHVEGTFLVKTHGAFLAGATLTGRVLAQTAVTLISNKFNVQVTE